MILIGAGIAGLSAARALAQCGQRVLVLEAKARPGGRLHSVPLDGLAAPAELGAEFVHGRPPELLELLQEAGLSTHETSGDDLTFRDGVLRERDDEDASWALLERMGETASRSGDMSFDRYLDAIQAPPHLRGRVRSFVEGFNAADASVIGIEGLAYQQAAEDAIEGDRAARLARGYSALAEYLAERAQKAGATLLLDTPVTQVIWQRGHCTVRGADGREWQSRRVVVTLPLGVLQAGIVVFSPEPEAALAAARKLAHGPVQRWVFQFKSRFWASTHPHLRFLFVQDEAAATPFPVWWAQHPAEQPILTAWAAGPRALGAAWEDRQSVIASALRALEAVFGRPLEDEFVDAHTHNWQTDPHARGAYSYAPAGAADCSAILAMPVENTLFFAGEHTDITGHPGTVHGALRSGLRAASQILTAG